LDKLLAIMYMKYHKHTEGIRNSRDYYYATSSW